MWLLKAACAILICAVLSPSLGAAGQAGLLLRIRKKYLEEEFAKRLTNFNLGGHLTDLVAAHEKQRNSGAGKAPPRTRRHFGNHPPPPPRIRVEMPRLPETEITLRFNHSLNIRFRVLFGVYLEQSFDPSSKEVEIQLRKDFSVLFSRSGNGLSIEGCHSCPDSLDIKTLYKASNTLVDDASPMVHLALEKDLIPVLGANACTLIGSALSGTASSLLSPGLFDFSPPGTQYSIKSMHMKEDHLVLELQVSDRKGGTGEGEEERNVGLSESLPSMREEAASDIIITETQMDWHFGPLLHHFEPIVVDKTHRMEVEYLVVNLTVSGPARFALDYDYALLNHPVNIEVSNMKEPSNSTWTFSDVISVNVDVSAEDNKLILSMSPESAFLSVEGKNDEARDFTEVLERALDLHIPANWLDPVRKQLPLPMAPGVGETVEIQVEEHFILISIIPNLDASQLPAGE